MLPGCSRSGLCEGQPCPGLLANRPTGRRRPCLAELELDLSNRPTGVCHPVLCHPVPLSVDSEGMDQIRVSTGSVAWLAQSREKVGGSRCGLDGARNSTISRSWSG